MRTIIITFTHDGMKVAKKAAHNMVMDKDMKVDIYCHSRCASSYECAESFDSVGKVIREQFIRCDRILFICAVAIAVRTLAPYIKSKVTDPAVLVADEQGRFLISLLSGHIGGANEWCEQLSYKIGAIPVITTATDARGVFAVDVFAIAHNMRIVNPVMIQDISGRILNGEPVGITGGKAYEELIKETVRRWCGQLDMVEAVDRNTHINTCACGYEVANCENAVDKCKDLDTAEYESGIQIITDIDEHIVFKRTLKLVPMDLTVGIGCKKGKTEEQIRKAVKDTFDKNRLLMERIAVVASVDRKADEQGIIDFAGKMRVPYTTYSPEYLNTLEGEFTSSTFVRTQVGVDNVCERSAYAASENKKCIVKKTVCDGITVAVYM